MWGSAEAVEMQVLLLLEVLMLAERGDSKDSRRRLQQRYDDFVHAIRTSCSGPL